MNTIQHIFKTLSITIIVRGFISFCYGEVNTDLNNYISTINTTIAQSAKDNEYQSASVMISKLCTSIYTTDNTTINYDAKQSLVVTLICNSLAKGVENKTLTTIIKKNSIIEYLKRSSRQEMGLLCPHTQNTIQNNGECVPSDRDNSMDYNYLFLKSIQKAMNDRSNIETARLYGFKKIDGKKEDLANLYLATYYQTLGKTTEKKDYPKTYAELITYISNTRSIIDKLYLINIKQVKNQSSDIQSKYCLRNNLLLVVGGEKAQSQHCISKDYSDHTSYINAIYNELFFYTLFSSFYEQYAPIFFMTQHDQEPYTVRNFISQKEKIDLLQQQAQDHRKKIISATQTTIKQLNNLQGSFPLHIGLLLYQEDMYKFRKNLANIYLPFHQLHYKLENVQSKT